MDDWKADSCGGQASDQRPHHHHVQRTQRAVQTGEGGQGRPRRATLLPRKVSPGPGAQTFQLVWGAKLRITSPCWQTGVTGCVLRCVYFPGKRGNATRAAEALCGALGSGSNAPELALASAWLAQTRAVPSPAVGGGRRSDKASRAELSRGQGLGPKSCEAVVLKVAQARPPSQ